MPFLKTYYLLKPLIPKKLQLSLRSKIVKLKRLHCQDRWPIDESMAIKQLNWQGWPEQKNFAFVLTHDVESKRGLLKCLQLAELEESFGFRSSFNFVAEDYEAPKELLDLLRIRGFEIGLHGLKHNGNLFATRKKFQKQVPRINGFLDDWGASGFRCPSMFHNLEWLGDLNIDYDSSTFDTDPFEPQPDGVGTIYPFLVESNLSGRRFVELPYTLPQDHLLFVLMKEKGIDIWKDKLDWLVNKSGMAMVITHPDYINFNGQAVLGEYPIDYYRDFLQYVKTKYAGKYWHALPKDVATFYLKSYKSQNLGS